MPTVTEDELKKLVDFIVDLKARQEAAETLLKRHAEDFALFEQERQSAYGKIAAVPKVLWLRTNLPRVTGRDLEHLLQALGARK